jgi:hypothetical protein
VRNPLAKIVDWIYALFGYATIGVELTQEERDQLEEAARRIGLTHQLYIQAMLVKHVLDHQDEIAEALANEKRRGSDVSS